MDGWNRRLSWQVRLESLEFTTCPPGFTKSISEQCNTCDINNEMTIFIRPDDEYIIRAIHHPTFRCHLQWMSCERSFEFTTCPPGFTSILG